MVERGGERAGLCGRYWLAWREREVDSAVIHDLPEAREHVLPRFRRHAAYVQPCARGVAVAAAPSNVWIDAGVQHLVQILVVLTNLGGSAFGGGGIFQH